MIPILYEKTETAFSSNGLGRLSDCIRCIATEARNGIYEVEFDYPVTGVLFSEIQEGRIIACTHDEQGDVQPFDIYGRSEPINGVVTFYAHHISYRLNEITVAPFNATSCAEALMKVKAYSINNNPFTFLTDKSVTANFDHKAPKNAKEMLVGSQGSILDIYGTGEYKYNKFEVDLYLHRGQDTNVSIRYGKNLIDYRNDFDVSNSYTAVVPYWLGEVTDGEESVSNLVMLPELFISSGHQVPSGREVVIPMDLSSDFQEPPTVEELRALATGRLRASEGWLPNQTVTVNFVQLWQTEEYKDYAPLQRLSLCDTCGIFVPMYGTSLRAKVITVVYNVLLDRYDEMELGDKPSTFASALEKTYNSKVAGVVAGLQAIAVDINTVQNIAAADATAKATQAQANAISTASADATSKANQAEANAVSTASADATAKANAAEQSAVSTASADATSKANSAEQNAKNYADSGISSLRSDLETQIDAKIETWAQSTNPASAWTTTELRTEHNNDLWLYTGTSNLTVGSVTIRPQGVYKYNGTNNTWTAYSSTSNNLFDLADGKSTIFYGSTSGTYANKKTGDYLVDSSNGATYRWNGSSWVKQTDYQTYTTNAIASAKTTIQSEYEQAIEDATELIRGGTGGYVVTTVNANGQPIELLITDNLNLNQARNVWRWNQGGLAHSSNGYNGPFSDVAITADGKINASMILTGALTANLIRAGIITDASGKNTWNLDSGQFTTKQGTIADYQINQNSLLCETVDERGTVSHAELTGSRFEVYQRTDNPPITRPAFSGIRLENNTIGIRYKSSSSSSISGTSINPLFGIAFYMGEGDTADVWSNNLPTIGTIKGTVAGLNLSPLGEADAVNVFGDLVVSGRKPRMVKTDNYQDRLLFCYETPTPLFGDIGEAVLDEEGLCYVDLDDIFSETIADQVEYQAFLQKEGEGDCWITEKQPRFFVIKGTPGLKVAWELKAKQKGYETQRLEQYGVKLDEYRGVAEQDSLLDLYIREQEDLLYG